MFSWQSVCYHLGMGKMLASLVMGGTLLVAPVYVAADTNAQNDQLTTLMTQLVALLQQEVLALQYTAHPALSIYPSAGRAQLTVIFTVTNRTGTEAIDYGDGRSTGSFGCVKNMFGFCDLSTSVSHLYFFPGTYTATLYTHIASTSRAVSSTTITVLPPTSS
jgi:hypothetical protein